MPVSDLPSRSPGRWAAATRHPFLAAVRDGTLPDPALDTWLAQDALFVADLLAFQARLLARAPREAQMVLAGGCVALVEELAWFDELAERRGLRLDAAPRPATLAYRALLARLDAAPYPHAVAALWVVERVYLDAWSGAAPAGGPHAELVEHWTAPGFDAYVAGLQRLADATPLEDVAALLDEVLDAETAFWDMALS